MACSRGDVAVNAPAKLSFQSDSVDAVTLVVSLRVPDGIVLAADSLATLPGAMALQINQQVECPHCHQQHQQNNVQDRLMAELQCTSCDQPFTLTGITIPPVGFTQSTASYAQKMFPFLGKFGIGIFGTPIVGTKTVVNHLKGLERSLRLEEDEHGTRLGDRLGDIGVSEVAKRIFEFITERVNAEGEVLTQQGAVLGMQIVGFDRPDDHTGKTFTAMWRAGEPTLECEDGLSFTYSGDRRIVEGLVQVLNHWRMLPNSAIFSLQDAVDFAEFLISITSTAQRFAPIIPTVGGEVDIALVTSYAGFQWIKVKPLTRQLEQPLA